MCVYGDMELQERAVITEFMSGPLPVVNSVVEPKQSSNGYSNQILGYLLGFTPKLDVEDQKNETWENMLEEKKRPKVNSRDAKLHFLMGRYNSN